MKTKRISFWKIVFSAIKEAKKTYKAKIQEQQNKHKLLSSHSDWSLIEEYIQQCNQNPDLKVTIITNDNTKIIMTCYKPEKVSFDKMLSDITVEE